MLTRRQIKSYFYHYGLKANFSFESLRRVTDACDIALQFRDYRTRRKSAEALLEDSPWRGFMPKERGYARFDAGALPGMAPMMAVAREIYQERHDSALTGAEQNTSPFVTLLRPGDLDQHAALLDFALSDPILHVSTDYLGVVPRLDYIELWISTPRPTLRGSHFFHLDKPDVPNVSVFVNLFDVTAENGPLTFIPRDRSQTVRDRTSYDKVYFGGDGRLADDRVFPHCAPENLVSLTGPAGSGGFVDTSRCFHCGSRCQSGERVVLTMRFRAAHKHDGGIARKLHAIPRFPKLAQRLVLAG